jgi:hypothetical protein
MKLKGSNAAKQHRLRACARQKILFSISLLLLLASSAAPALAKVGAAPSTSCTRAIKGARTAGGHPAVLINLLQLRGGNGYRHTEDGADSYASQMGFDDISQQHQSHGLGRGADVAQEDDSKGGQGSGDVGGGGLGGDWKAEGGDEGAQGRGNEEEGLGPEADGVSEDDSSLADFEMRDVGEGRRKGGGNAERGRGREGGVQVVQEREFSSRQISKYSLEDDFVTLRQGLARDRCLNPT